jgi:hypothetical protein
MKPIFEEVSSVRMRSRRVWFEEFKMIINIIPKNCTCLNALRYFIENNLSEIYSNMIVLNIFANNPVMLYLAEWSFSKLKLTEKSNFR